MMGRRVLTAAAFAVVFVGSAAAATHLAYSTASNNVVQRQPPPGSCHAIGTGLSARPDPRCTPGALNPQVTQASIGRTICRDGWTATVRPPETITEAEKRASLRAYGDRRPIWDYEYDHFVPLELGGATNDARNLWPEPGASPNPKDEVEYELKRAVCDGRMTLARAQDEVVTNWMKLARHGIGVPTGPQPTPNHHEATCSASASWNSRYGDYDVYVHSNQPDRWASVTGAGKTAGYDTNSSGYADVYLHAGQSDAGDEISVRVGAATCSAVL